MRMLSECPEPLVIIVLYRDIVKVPWAQPCLTCMPHRLRGHHDRCKNGDSGTDENLLPTSSFFALGFFSSHVKEAVSEGPQLGLHPSPPPSCCSLPSSYLLPASHSPSPDQIKAV